MSKNPKTPPPFPSKQDVLKFIQGANGQVSANEIARAFHIRGDGRKKLDQMVRDVLRSMAAQHQKSAGGKPPKKSLDKKFDDRKEFSKTRVQRDAQHHAKPANLAPTSTIEITGTNEDGDFIAQPSPWEGRKAPPFILVTDDKGFSLKLGDQALAKLTRWDSHSYGAKILKILPNREPQKIVGVFRKHRNMGTIEPVNRKDKWQFEVAPIHWEDAANGDLVEAVALPKSHTFGRGFPMAKITKSIGAIDSPKSSSLVAIARHGIPIAFSEAGAAQAEASAAAAITLNDRVDLRTIPLVTIDGEDARDFDDAVWAELDSNPKNAGGWHLLVAIADVAHYVHPYDALDQDALLRGNSVYFPDRVVPMLPESLSNGVCSLKPDEDRNCLAVHIWIDAAGNTLRYQFVRGLMRSHARLTYNKAQEAFDSKDAVLWPIVEPLFGAFKCLLSNRNERGSLELDLPEYQVKINDEGKVTEIGKRVRLDSHKLIEEFMIAANVAAADAILQKNISAVFRVHEPPPADRVSDLQDFLKQLGFAISKGDGIQAQHFNKVLEKTKDTPHAALIHTSILRTQTAAYYSPKNLGHFGLALTHYTHFTSPIRRYSDLLVHRALITLLFPKEDRADGMTKEQAAQLEDMAQHISTTERRAMLAERDAMERYMVHYMADHIGWTGAGAVSGINQFGLFVTLPETGATGFIPISTVTYDFFRYVEKEKSFIGNRTHARLQLGQMKVVRLREANTITGSLRFELVHDEVLGAPIEKVVHSKHKKDVAKNRHHGNFERKEKSESKSFMGVKEKKRGKKGKKDHKKTRRAE